MFSPRWVTTVALVVVGGVVVGAATGCGGATPAETSVTSPPAIPVVVNRTGGIAGVNQTIEISVDGTWVYRDNRLNEHENGKLAPDQRVSLQQLVHDPDFATQLARGGSTRDLCADAFHYLVETSGEAQAYEDCGAETEAPAVKSVLALITEATPF
jgi:hypothetical protein